jgi:hypothetical protein
MPLQETFRRVLEPQALVELVSSNEFFGLNRHIFWIYSTSPVLPISVMKR